MCRRVREVREVFIKEVSFKGQVGKDKEGRIGTCQVHLVLKDKSRRKYIWFEKNANNSIWLR